jgi:hypothetical protein
LEHHREVVPAEAQDQRHLGVENELARLVADGIDQLRQGATPRHGQPEVGEEDTEGYRFLHHRGESHDLKPAPK